MKIIELRQVRDLMEQIDGAKRKARALRDSQHCLTPILDGLPKSDRKDSRIEILTVLIVDAEREIDELQAQLTEAIANLARKIKSEYPDQMQQALLLMRYVFCYEFADIAMSLGCSERRIYKMHEDILKGVFANECS